MSRAHFLRNIRLTLSVPYVRHNGQIVFTIRQAPLLLAGLAWLDMLTNFVFIKTPVE